jgi:hypothetical protein
MRNASPIAKRAFAGDFRARPGGGSHGGPGHCRIARCGANPRRNSKRILSTPRSESVIDCGCAGQRYSGLCRFDSDFLRGRLPARAVRFGRSVPPGRGRTIVGRAPRGVEPGRSGAYSSTSPSARPEAYSAFKMS